MQVADDREGSGVPTLGRKVLRPSQQVEQVLRQAILDRELRPGDKLPPEVELARQFGVSRPTIREALSRLASKGLIRKLPGAGGGSFVQATDYLALGQIVQESIHNVLTLGGVEFDEISHARQYLEVPAAALAARHRTEEQLNEIKGILGEQVRRSVDDPLISTLDAQFHSKIAEMSGNRVLASLVYALHHESEPVTYLELSPEVGRETVAQHRRIVDAIESGDVEDAEAAIKEHLIYLRGRIRERIPTPAHRS